MLVFGRKEGETVVIGDDIRITVLQRRGSQIRLGVEAPKHIPVHREEVYDAIQAESRMENT